MHAATWPEPHCSSPTNGTDRGSTSPANFEVLDLPDALEPLVAYYQSIAGEHPDWNDYRNAMVDQGKCLLRLTIETWGPISDRRVPRTTRGSMIAVGSKPANSCAACCCAPTSPSRSETSDDGRRTAPPSGGAGRVAADVISPTTAIISGSWPLATRFRVTPSMPNSTSSSAASARPAPAPPGWRSCCSTTHLGR